MHIDGKLEREVACIGDLSREELVAAWIKAYGCAPPAGVRRDFLVRAAAWHFQARRLGGLSAATNKLLRSAIRDVEAKLAARRVPASSRSTARADDAIASETNPNTVEQRVDGSDRLQAAPKPRKVLSPGSRLMRDWNGRTYVVDVLGEGFAFEGKIHRSLSVIARSITPLVGSKVLRAMSGGGTKLRCAVYTRKSTEEGLDQEFNSLDAQREACLAFVASQVGLGWRPVADRYDDGGISGGTMERPALQRLLQDIRDRQVDVVAVYKIDRLTRSLMDFSKIVEIFDAHGVSFVSVTQQFNTTTSMGRLTLNVLLSFAQFEREVTAERIRDKIAASRKKGIWMGGTVPMGYRAIDKKLVVDEEAAAKVRTIFARYLEIQSVIGLADELNAGVAADLESTFGQPSKPAKSYSRGKLYHMLANPVYLGKAKHREHLYDGDHQAIVDKDVFDRAQLLLKGQAPHRRSASSTADLHLLIGIVYYETGDRLSTVFTSNHGRRYRYYVSNRLKIAHKKDLTGWRIPADQLEGAVVHQVRAALGDQVRLSRWLSAYGSDIANGVKTASSLQKKGFDRLSHGDQRSLIRSLFPRIVVAPGSMQLDVDPGSLVRWLDGSEDKAAQNKEVASSSIETITVPLLIKRRGNEVRIVIEGRNPTRTDPGLVELIGRAHYYLSLLTDGAGRSLADLAKATGVHIADISRVLPLAFLAPALVDAILTGRHPVELTARQLSRLSNLPVDWQQQRALLSF